MSFGWSAGDIVSAISLAVKVYNNYHNAGGELNQLTQSIAIFKHSLEEALKALKPILLETGHDKSLGPLGKQTVDLLTDLNRFIEKNANPKTGKLLMASRLIWQSSAATELQSRIHRLTSQWQWYCSSVTNRALLKDQRAILERLDERQYELVPRKLSTGSEVQRDKTVPYDTGWEQPLMPAKAEEGDYHGPFDASFSRSSTLAAHDSTFSRSSTLVPQSSTPITRVQTGSSGSTTSSGGKKPSFMDARPKQVPYTMNPSRLNHTKSAPVIPTEKDSHPDEKRRVSATAIMRSKITFAPPGSSAPSLSQQRSPFGRR